MVRGSKAAYGDKHKHMVEPIEQSEKGRGKEAADCTAWATVYKVDRNTSGSRKTQ